MNTPPQKRRREVEQVLDKLLQLYDRLLRAEIDSSHCRTKLDYEQLQEAQDAYWEGYNQALTRLAEMSEKEVV